VEVVQLHINRIREVNGALNAVVRDRFDEALLEARRADERLHREGPDGLPPLHGVPCTIKECFQLTGMPNSSGLVARRDVVASEDATAVHRLRQAGAIPLGVTNVSELCMWWETSNLVYGRTSNPYDTRRIVGGSSGGEGAIVGAGGVPFGLGADIGGSIRMPAFFNGVFGHKPSGRRVPNTGQYPLPEEKALRYNCTGPLARRAEDLWPLLRILAGPDGHDAECTEMPFGDPATVDLKGMPVLVVEEHPTLRATAEVRDSVRRAGDALSDAGARVTPGRIDGLRHALDIWSTALAEARTPFEQLLGSGEPLSPGRELLRWLFRRSPYTIPAITLVLIERFVRQSPKRAAQATAAGVALRRELHERIGEGVLLFPTHPTVAPLHGVPLLRPFWFAYTPVFNIMELPVTAVPLGLNRSSLPLGVQVVGGPAADHRTIAVALELERRLGGWVIPPRTVRTLPTSN
jgi:fatty acid amide hydrolase 2